MKKTIPLILICLGLVACKEKSTEMKSDWQLVVDAKTAVYIDKNSVKGKKEKSFWAKIQEKEKKDSYGMSYVVVDCENNMYKQTQISFYVKDIQTENKIDKKAEYENIVPDTKIMIMRNFVCNINN